MVCNFTFMMGTHLPKGMFGSACKSLWISRKYEIHQSDGGGPDQQNPYKWEFVWDQNTQDLMKQNIIAKICEQGICGHFANKHGLGSDVHVYHWITSSSTNTLMSAFPIRGPSIYTSCGPICANLRPIAAWPIFCMDVPSLFSLKQGFPLPTLPLWSEGIPRAREKNGGRWKLPNVFLRLVVETKMQQTELFRTAPGPERDPC